MINHTNNNVPVSLQNKIVVIAGGSNKQGKVIAEKLAQTGASIVIADVHLINAEIVVQYLIEKYKTVAAAVGPNIDEIKAIVAKLKPFEEGQGRIAIWVNAGLLNKEIQDIDKYIPELTKFLTLQNNSYGSNFRVSCFINCFCLSAHGWVDGTEFWQKVLALVLDILSVAVH
jgi:NAD(P)-dependent dehydrogenase (short-subunit alcohol dehydrogenase family)